MFRRRTTAAWIAVAALVAGTGCGERTEDGPTATATLLAQTLVAIAEARPYRPRFTGAEPHVACSAPGDGDERPSMRCRPIEFETVRRAARLAVAYHRRPPPDPAEPDAVRVGALLDLFSADPARSVGEAAERLGAALRRGGGSPELLNDLAALLLVRSELLDAPADAVTALRHASEALALRSPFPEAETNKALALEALTLWSAAAESWKRTESAAGGAGWRAEARANRRRCEARARDALPDLAARAEPPDPPTRQWVDSNPFAARRAVESRLGRWASLSRRGHAGDAEAALRAAAQVAELLARRTGDHLYLDSVRRIREAEDGPASDLRALAEGHTALDAARAGGIYSDCSGPALATAERALTAAASPFAGWALLDGAICAYFAKDFRLAEAKLDSIAALTRDRSYRTLDGRRSWILALVRMVQGRYDEAIASLRDALDSFERAGELEHVTYLHSMVAKTYRYLGARELAWRHRMRALGGRGRITSPERVFTVFEDAVEALRAEGAGAEILFFLDEQLAAADRAAREGDWDIVVYTLLDRRELLQALERTEEADADLDRAEAAWARLPAGHESRHRLRLELDLHRADAAGDDEARLAAIRRGLAFFQRGDDVAGDRIQVLALHRAAAAVHVRRGRLGQAERALLASLEEAETQRSRLMHLEHRASFLDEMRDLADRMVELQLDGRRDPWRALDFVERASNRVLQDRLAPARVGGPNGAGEAGWRRAAERLPEGLVLVRYGRLGDRLLVWTIARERISFEERDVPRRLLSDAVASARKLLRQPRARPLLDSVLAELAAMILPDAVQRLPDRTDLVFVVDDTTAGIPFAALRDGADGGYLGERHPIGVTPSLLVHLRLLERGGDRRETADETQLVVVDPRFDRDLFPALQPLPAARRAGDGLRRLYPRATLVTGTEATEPGLLATLPGHELFHFEGHALTDPANGARSALLLAPADPARPDRESSLLRAEELLRLDLSRVRLIVLAACSTAVGLYPESREVANLATAFLAAGAPAVVASLWDVDDASSATLFQEFHWRLAAGRAPAVALQQAQAALRRSDDDRLAHPTAWAGFAVFGHGGAAGAGGNVQTTSVE